MEKMTLIGRDFGQQNAKICIIAHFYYTDRTVKHVTDPESQDQFSIQLIMQKYWFSPLLQTRKQSNHQNKTSTKSGVFSIP